MPSNSLILQSIIQSLANAKASAGWLTQSWDIENPSQLVIILSPDVRFVVPIRQLVQQVSSLRTCGAVQALGMSMGRTLAPCLRLLSKFPRYVAVAGYTIAEGLGTVHA